mgnify:CR=1 FL=1
MPTEHDRLAALSIDALIAAVRARKITDRHDDYPDNGASAADNKHQREKEGE